MSCRAFSIATSQRIRGHLTKKRSSFVYGIREKVKFILHSRRSFHIFLFFILRGDRIVIGEVRGKEAFDLLQAMNTGHDGSFSTGHGNSPRDMLSRLETMVLMAADLPLSAIRGQIASAVDVMVHVARMRDKSRKVVAIEEVDGIENGEIILNPVFSCGEEGCLKKVGDLKHKEKLRMAGYGL